MCKKLYTEMRPDINRGLCLEHLYLLVLLFCYFHLLVVLFCVPLCDSEQKGIIPLYILCSCEMCHQKFLHVSLSSLLSACRALTMHAVSEFSIEARFSVGDTNEVQPHW